MKALACPQHGRKALTNAGAPNVVRCCTCGTVFELRDGAWRVRPGKLGSPYPVS